MSEGNNNITIGQLTETINNKMDRDGLNANTSWIFVVSKQDPTPENGYTWYRKYSDGWVEQGGISNANSSGVAVTLPVAMQDANYTAVVGNGNSSSNADYTAWCGATSRTTTGFNFYVKGYGGSGTSYNACWYVSGYAVM